MSQYPAFIQACLLFDSAAPYPLADLIKSFLGAEAGLATSYNLVFDTKPGVFYRLFGTNGVMITVEFVPGQARAPLFETALSLPFTKVATPDARERISNHKSHVIVGVHHGAIPPEKDILAFTQKLGVALPGASLREFRLRLALCGRLAAMAHRLQSASLVHWTCTDHLMTGDAFSGIAEERGPGLLHVHPIPFQAGERDGAVWARVKVFGAEHFLGQEVHVAPSPAPWIDHFAPILAFLNNATAENGYVPPDGDTFAPEDESVCYRVRHIRAGASLGEIKGPCYVLELLHSAKRGLTSPDYIPPIRSFDDRALPAEVEGRLGQRKPSLVAEWRAQRQQAEAAGNTFRIKYDPDKLTPAPRSALRRPLRLLPGASRGTGADAR